MLTLETEKRRSDATTSSPPAARDIADRHEEAEEDDVTKKYEDLVDVYLNEMAHGTEVMSQSEIKKDSQIVRQNLLQVVDLILKCNFESRDIDKIKQKILSKITPEGEFIGYSHEFYSSIKKSFFQLCENFENNS